MNDKFFYVKCKSKEGDSKKRKNRNMCIKWNNSVFYIIIIL